MTENKNIIGNVHSLESFGLVDGPGVRFVVFLQGCALRCRFCHNPDTWKSEGEQWTVEKLYKHVLRYRRYWSKNGGITVSGGEPLLQIDFVTELFKMAKKDRVHTAIDTAGQPFSDDPQWMKKFEQLMSVTDLVLLDLKEIDSEKHKNLTGFGNENILKMAQWLSEHGKTMWIRHVLVPSVTDDPKGLEEMYRFISQLKTVERVEVLPYHTLGIIKWYDMGLKYSLEGISPPTQEEIAVAEQILHTTDYMK